ncbi:MAG: ThiF family adenylyltransferase [Planctomycetota bacterium]
MAEPLTISTRDHRFSRFELIGWWDQQRLASARVIVVGAGALGNELLKNLALLGVGQRGHGHVTIIDMDDIEHSNLSRSVLYRAEDAGRKKAEVAAERAAEIYPDMDARAVVGDVKLDLGLGAFREADVVLGGLDNREARLAINRACYRVGTPWVDGAIQVVDGIARVFVPPGACYECTMNKTDWQVLQHRRSCAGLSRKEMEGGKVPTTPTVGSIIAGVQVQEAVKLLHGIDTIAGKGWSFNGAATDAWQTEYDRKEDCLSHDPLLDVRPVGTDSTFGGLLEEATRLGAPNLELPKTLLRGFRSETGEFEPVDDLLERVSAERLSDPRTGAARHVVTLDAVSTDTTGTGPNLLGLRPADVGFPSHEIFTARTPAGAIGLELSDDTVEDELELE